MSHLNDTAESRLKKTFFIVEATSFEVSCLWRDYCNRSDRPRYGEMTWKQVNPGWMIHICDINNRPCNISTSWYEIDGKLVMFWYATSQLVDYLEIEKWLEEKFAGTYGKDTRRAATDANNFHLCIQAIIESNEQQ